LAVSAAKTKGGTLLIFVQRHLMLFISSYVGCPAKLLLHANYRLPLAHNISFGFSNNIKLIINGKIGLMKTLEECIN